MPCRLPINLPTRTPWFRLAALTLLATLWAWVPAFAQGKKQLLQVSGLVVSGGKMEGVPGVFLYVPKAGRGVQTNPYGYFSMPCMPGDSIIISALGYKKQFYNVPKEPREYLSLIFTLSEDTLSTPVVDILPWPTEELFKQAVLSLNLPKEDLYNMRRNLDETTLARLRFELEPTPGMNHTYFMQQQVIQQQLKGTTPMVSLLNPFAWARFIESIKRGDLDPEKRREKKRRNAEEWVPKAR